MGVMRVAAIGLAGLVIWTVSASRVPDHERLPLASIVIGAVMTQPFGCTWLEVEPVDRACGGGHFHSGIDLAAPAGTAVRAAAAGIARSGYDPGGAGLYIVVAGADNVRILYCHLSVVLVGNGAAVTAGEVIGRVGATGLATGAHLHLEVQVNRRPVDPARWLAS